MSMWSSVADGYQVVCPKCQTEFELTYNCGSLTTECPNCGHTGSWSEEFTEESDSLLVFAWD